MCGGACWEKTIVATEDFLELVDTTEAWYKLHALLYESILIFPGAIPKFTASSPELQDLLTRVRERIFLPAHVSKSQRNLIFNSKYKKSLETEAAIATIADEEFRLRHLDVSSDVPSKKTVVYRAVSLMKEKQDWDNLPNLMGGLKTVGAQFSVALLMNVVATAGKAGRQDVVLECLRRADYTGMTLAHHELAVQVFYWLSQKAFSDDWSTKETKKVLAWAEITRELMDEPMHKTLPKGVDPKSPGESKDQPEIAGMLLQLAAMRATQTGKDEERKVERYAKELLGTPLKFREVEAAGAMAIQHPNYWLSAYVQVLHGTKVALSLFDPASKVGKGLKAMHNKLEPMVLAVRNQLVAQQEGREKPLYALTVYEKVLGSGSS